MSDSLVHEVLESYIYWAEACQDVRRAYRRWQDSKEPGRGIEFSLYSAVLDHEEYAAAIHSFRTARLHAPNPSG